MSSIDGCSLRKISVPQELVDIVIDFLFDDKGTLSSCCLVNREWVPSSRLHLFRTIFIQGGSLRLDKMTMDSPSNVIPGLDDLPVFKLARIFHAFTEFVARSPELLTTNIHQLVVSGEGCHHSESPVISVGQIQDLLLHLPHLKRLDLIAISLLTAISGPVVDTYPLQQLETMECKASSECSLALLSMLPDLESMTWGISDRQEGKATSAQHPVALPPTFRCKLQRLTISPSMYKCPASSFLTVLERASQGTTHNPLTTLSFEQNPYRMDDLETRIVNRIIECVGWSIETLTLTQEGIPSRSGRSFDWWRCMALRELCFDATMETFDRPHNIAYLAMAVITRTFASVLTDLFRRPEQGPKDVVVTIDLQQQLNVSAGISEELAEIAVPYLGKGMSALRILMEGQPLSKRNRRDAVRLLRPLHERGALRLR